MSDIFQAAPAISIPVRCHYCSRFHPRRETRFIGGVAAMCQKCQHEHVRNVMEFHPPRFCQGCNRSTEELAKLVGEDFRMAVHFKDGIYQVLCMDCDAKYVKLRADLYRDTPFGYHERKL